MAAENANGLLQQLIKGQDKLFEKVDKIADDISHVKQKQIRLGGEIAIIKTKFESQEKRFDQLPCEDNAEEIDKLKDQVREHITEASTKKKIEENGLKKWSVIIAAIGVILSVVLYITSAFLKF